MTAIRRPLARFFAVAALVFALSATAALPPGVTQDTSVEGITQYTLVNGLTVLLFSDATAAKTTVNLTYLVGSRHENYGETGMAHLLEHMMFKGTSTSGDQKSELTKRGMRFNASTWYDRTNYHETFNASPADLQWVLGMEADRMINSKVARADLDSEMTVVRNEMEMGENNPFSILIKRLTGVLYHTVPGAHPDATAVSALARIMTTEPGGRLYTALVEGKKATAVQNFTPALHDPGFVAFFAQLPLSDSLDRARETMEATL